MCIKRETTLSLTLVLRMVGCYNEWNTREFRQAIMAHATGPCARQYVAIKRKVEDGKTHRNKTS